jgi:hypothetical protein
MPPIISFDIGTVPIMQKSNIQVKRIYVISTGVTLPALSTYSDLVWNTCARIPEMVRPISIRASNHPYLEVEPRCTSIMNMKNGARRAEVRDW